MAPDPGAATEPRSGNMLIRAFSDELSKKNARDSINRALAAKVAVDREEEKRLATLRAQWGTFLQEGQQMAQQFVPSQEAVLLEQSRKLFAAWSKFLEKLPEDQRESLGKDVPSLKQLYQSVDTASKSWQTSKDTTKWGKIKQKFSSICTTMQDHSALLSVIPTNDKYISLLTGSLTAIAKASINHSEIAEGVADTLQELAEDIMYWNNLVEEWGQSDAVMRYIMELYVVVFEYLTEIFDEWSRSSWKRFVKSFDEGTFKRLFTERSARIRALERRMERHIQLEYQKEMRRAARSMQQSFQAMIEDRDQSAQQQRLDQQNMILQLGARIQQQLDQSLRGSLLMIADREQLVYLHNMVEGLDSNPKPGNSRPQLELSPSSQTSDVESEVENDQDPAPGSKMRRFEREKVLQCLQDHANQFGKDVATVVSITSKASRITIDRRIAQDLKKWTSSHASNKALWVQGPRIVHNPGQNTLTAVALVALASKHGVPCLSYFATLANATVPPPQVLLQNLLNSLVVQAVLLLPQTFTTSLDLSLNRFEHVFGDVNVDFEEALEMLKDLKTLLPPYTQWVIEGMQMLEDREDENHMMRLKKLLKALSSFASTENMFNGEIDTDDEDASIAPVMKLCFMTNGYVDALAELVEDDCLDKVAYEYDADQPGAEDGHRLMSPVNSM